MSAPADFPASMLENCYVLNEHNEVRSALEEGMSLIQWATWTFGRNDRQVARDIVIQPGGTEITISTVFLGTNMNHGLTEGPPLVFETMIFGHDLARVIDRYTSYAEAEAGHAKIVKGIQEA